MQWFATQEVRVQALLASLVMYFATSFGASFVLFSKKIPNALLTVLTGAAAGIMLAASFFSLLLPAIETEGPLPPFLPATFGFALGGGALILCGALLSRTEAAFRNFGDRKNALLFFAVTAHNVPEGLAVGVAFAAANGNAVLSAVLLAVGIAVQNFPEGLCVAFPLRAKGVSPAKSFLFSQGSGLVEIPACLLGAAAASVIGGLMPWVLSFSAGAMIAVVCSELLPECYEGNKLLSSAGLILGFCAMMALDVAFG